MMDAEAMAARHHGKRGRRTRRPPDQRSVPTTRWIERRTGPLRVSLSVLAVAPGEQGQSHAAESASGAMVF